jgi:sirohydrochlorin ferrochelatase
MYPAWRSNVPRTALLLIAHGSRHAEANDDLRHAAAALRQRGHEIVVASFLELAEPDMLAGGRQCAAAGAERVVLVPYFLSAGVHVRRDLTAAREALAREFPGVEFLLAEALGRHPLLLDVVEQRVGEVLSVPEAGRPRTEEAVEDGAGGPGELKRLDHE